MAGLNDDLERRDGGWVGRCEPCGYETPVRLKPSDARGALTQHQHGQQHIANVRRASRVER